MNKEEIRHLSQSYHDLHQKYDKLQQENKQLKEVIDKLYCWGEALDPTFQKDLLDILKEEE